MKYSWIDKNTWTIRIPKEVEKSKRPKKVYLIEDDIKLIKSLPALDENMYFFRNKDGSRFGKKKLYKWWKRACANLDIYDIELYAGTRHSSCIALSKLYSPEAIRLASQHSTDRAFERYFRFDDQDYRDIYNASSPDKALTKPFLKVNDDN